jgi:hypothetical protein
LLLLLRLLLILLLLVLLLLVLLLLLLLALLLRILLLAHGASLVKHLRRKEQAAFLAGDRVIAPQP